MRIVYLHQYFKTPDMAGGTRSYEMAKRLVEWGHEVELITSRTEPSGDFGWSIEVIDRIKIHYFSVPYNNKMGFLRRVKAFFSFAFYASLKAASMKADLVFATSTPLTIALPGVYASRKLKVPMIFEVRDLWPEMPIALGVIKNPVLVWLAKKLELFAYNNSKHVIALSEDMARGVIRTGYAKSAVTVIPNSSDLALFDPNKACADRFRAKFGQIPSSGPIVLYPGTLGTVNGVSYLVDLAREASRHNSDVIFLVIGDGIECDKVREQAETDGVLNKNFFMINSLPKNELVDAFNASSIISSCFVDVPEMEANSANKFFDALAAGRPVAINYGGWQKEVIESNGVGVALSRDPVDAVLTLTEYLADKDKVEQAGINSRAIAINNYSRDLLAKKLEDAMYSVVRHD